MKKILRPRAPFPGERTTIEEEVLSLVQELKRLTHIRVDRGLSPTEEERYRLLPTEIGFLESKLAGPLH